MIEGTVQFERGKDIDRYQAGDVLSAAAAARRLHLPNHHLRCRNLILPVSVAPRRGRARAGLRPAALPVPAPGQPGGPGPVDRRQPVHRRPDRQPRRRGQPADHHQRRPAAGRRRADRVPQHRAHPARPATAATPPPRPCAAPSPSSTSMPAQDISLADIAAAACVTVRAIQLAFRRELDTTPTGLPAHGPPGPRPPGARWHADPASESVTAVAYRWGFSAPAGSPPPTARPTASRRTRRCARISRAPRKHLPSGTLTGHTHGMILGDAAGGHAGNPGRSNGGG